VPAQATNNRDCHGDNKGTCDHEEPPPLRASPPRAASPHLSLCASPPHLSLCASPPHLSFCASPPPSHRATQLSERNKKDQKASSCGWAHG
jgi:hypothetical protein